MLQSKTISLPSSMSVAERISEVKKQLQEWLASVQPPFRYSTDALRLKKHERVGREHIYEYEILYRNAASPEETSLIEKAD